MMQDLAMAILDIANNAIRARACCVQITLWESQKHDFLKLEVDDDGCGMDEQTCAQAQDPFFTTRTTRRIGLGIPFFKGIAQQCQGDFTLRSQPGRGTHIGLCVRKSHWDVPPWGNLAETMITLIQASETIRWILEVRTDSGKFHLDTAEIQKELEEVSLCEPSILIWIRDYIEEQLREVQREGGTL